MKSTNKMQVVILLILISILALACSPKTDEGSLVSMGMVMNEEIEPSTENDITTQDLEVDKNKELIKTKIIKDGRLGIEVTDIKETKSNIDTLVRSFSAYYDNESFTNTDYENAYELKIRIPSEKFEVFVKKIEKGNGDVTYKEIEARDVTDQFIDLETRLTNKRKYLSSYQELLKKANSIKEILEIQERIRGLEEEIESTTGKLKYLSDLVNYSTLELKISQKKAFKYTATQRSKFTEKLKESFFGGWFAFVDFILILLYNWIFLIIIAITVYFVIRYKRKNKANKKI